MSQSKPSTRNPTARERNGKTSISDARRSVALFATLLSISLSGCGESPSQPAPTRTFITSVVTSAAGVSRVETVNAVVVESNGFVYVDAVVPAVSPAPIRFQIQQPVIVYLATAARGVGGKVIEDTAGLSFRVKSVVNAVPSEIAVLNAITADTIAVFRTSPVLSNGVVNTNSFSVRLPSGESISLNVNRPLAAAPRSTAPGYAEVASLEMTEIASSCFRRVFSLLAPPMLSAQSACLTEQRSLNTAATIQAATFAIGGPVIVGGIIQILGGVAASAVIPLSGTGATFNGVLQVGGMVLGMAAATWQYNDAVAALNTCKYGSGPKPKPYSTVRPSK